MQEVVYEVRSPKAERFSPGRLFAEGEVGGQIEIGNEAESITEGIGYVDIDEPLQHEIKSVMQAGCQDAHHDETYKFRDLFQLLHLLIYGCNAFVIGLRWQS